MRTKAKKKLLLVTAAFFTGFLVVTIKLSYVMIAQADKYLSLARNLHQRDREIKAPRGSILMRISKRVCLLKKSFARISPPNMLRIDICLGEADCPSLGCCVFCFSSSSISLSLFCNSQLGASGARIACHFFVAGNNNFVVD